MQLYFIRHGQSVNNALWERTESNHGRKMDPELTDTGHQQAELLAQFLTKPGAEMEPDAMDFQNRAGFNITHIYTSLMMRAVATGTVIADTLDLPLVAWHDLHESGGLFLEEEETEELVGQAGPNRAFFEQHYPKLEHNILSGDEGWWNSPFEPEDNRPLRARRVLNELVARHGGSQNRVAFISHGGIYNYLLMAVLGLVNKEGFWFLMNNTAISRLDFLDDRVILVYQNRTDHLPDDLIT